MSRHIRFISAGAGSGKTYRVTEDLQRMLASGEVRPSGVIATTFTRRAATELRERVRQKLMADGNAEQATQIGQALIGTVNGVCGELLGRFAFEAGLSPDQKVLEEEQAQRLFGVALEEILAAEPRRIGELNALAHRLGMLDRSTRQFTWRSEIMGIASAARANNMSPEQIRGWAESSADELVAMLPRPYGSHRDLDAELLGAVNHALAAVSTDDDTTKATQTYLTVLSGIQAGLVQHRLQWREWVSLAKAAPGAKSRVLTESIRQIAGEFEKHPQLHADVRGFCAEVFDLAAASIEAYQGLKAEQGLLDFVDQEHRMYRLLDDEYVRRTLAEELQVLFVDEFQDTSPIQLALFMKLAALADRVVWVGDVKQAIYGFRGSDPQLMQAVLSAVAVGGGRTDVLEHSWRSRPPLVDYINAVFVPAFAATMSPEQVELDPMRAEPAGTRPGEAAVACWHLAGSNWTKRANDIAFGIQQLIDSDYRVTDSRTNALRSVGYGDIAVLCRTNERLKQIASACARAGIPVAFKRPGLIATPECALALAALRRLVDKRDSLASAEIRTLIRGESPEQWLVGRLDHLAGEMPAWQWGEVGTDLVPELESLAEARAQRTLLTPAEALELALVKCRVREAVIAWGPSADQTRHRLRNVDLLLEYAAAYQDQCNMLSVAATLPGLILWLYDLGKRGEDWQAEAGDGRAVTLVTHHGAKGLEWPVVVAVDLDSDVRPRIWGLTVLQREAGFDIDAPLEGRGLRYWPWPFGGQATGIPLAEAVAASPLGAAARAAAAEETRRLLYVSLTRARDCLIVPLPAAKPTGEWLETLAAEWMLPTGESLELPSGRRIPTAFSRIEAPEDWAVAAQSVDARWVLPGQTSQVFLQRMLSPSSAAPVDGVTVGAPVEIGERMPFDSLADVTALGEAIHSIVAAEINAPDDDSNSRAAAILRAWGFASSIEPAAAAGVARAFVAWATEAFRPLAWYVEQPVTHVLETGQVVQGFIDVLLQTERGWVIVDHKATPRPKTEWADIAVRYSGQLAMYRAALEALGDAPVLSTWVHFAVGGGAVPVIFGDNV